MAQPFTAKPDLVAPTGLLSAGGTSFAAPAVSGAAVLLSARLLAGSGAAMSPGERAQTLWKELLSFRDPNLDPACTACLGRPHESVYGGGTLKVPPFRYTLTHMVSDSPSSDATDWSALFGPMASKSTKTYLAGEEGDCEEVPHPCEFQAILNHSELTPVAEPALHLWLHARPVPEPGPPKLSSLDAKSLHDVHVVEARRFSSWTWEGTADGAGAKLACGKYKIKVSGKPVGGFPEVCTAGASTPVPPLKEGWMTAPWAHFTGAIERFEELKKSAGAIGWTVSAPAGLVYGPVLHTTLAPQPIGMITMTEGPFLPYGANFEPVIYAELSPTTSQDSVVVLMEPGQTPTAPDSGCHGMHGGDYPGELHRTAGLQMRGSAAGPEYHVSECIPSWCGTECE
jgi:hypothetical protein